MSDSRVTLPVATFAQTMRALFPKHASESDERLIDIVASENPQCRFVREGTNVSLENLSSILIAEAAHQAEQATPLSEPTSGTTSSPVMANELIGSGKSKHGGKGSGETVSSSGAISECREQSDADYGRPRIPSFGLQEENKRPIALWVACIIGVLVLCGTGIYYAKHAKVERPNNASIEAVKSSVEADFYSAKYMPVGNGWGSFLVEQYDKSHNGSGEQGILLEMQVNDQNSDAGQPSGYHFFLYSPRVHPSDDASTQCDLGEMVTDPSGGTYRVIMVGVSGEGFLHDSEFYRENESYQGSYPAEGCKFVLTGVHSLGAIPEDVWARADRLWQQEEQKSKGAKAALSRPTDSASDSQGTDEHPLERENTAQSDQNNPGVTPYIQEGLKAKSFTARSSGVDLNGDGIPEVIALTACGGSDCEYSLSDGISHKEIYPFALTDVVHVLQSRTNGYSDLLEDSAGNLYIKKFNGEEYQATACYEWLTRNGSPVCRACGAPEGRQLVEISCETFQPLR